MSISVRLAVLFAGAYVLPSGAAYLENFDSINALSGIGWMQRNNSTPIGTTGWFAGNPSVFAAQSGVPSSYIAANLSSTGDTGTISNWLLTPALTLFNGDTFSFYTRTEAPVQFPDRLEVRLSTSMFSINVGTTTTSVGDFATQLLTVNPSLTPSGYPTAWTQYTITLSGLPALGSAGRIAFRYYVTEAGAANVNANYIGVDTFTTTGAIIPEPGTIVLLSAGLLGLAALRRIVTRGKEYKFDV